MRDFLQSRVRRNLLACGAFAALATTAAAQTYPDGPVTLIVPFPPGGSVDIVARAVAKPLSDALGKPVVVDNVAGASGNLAATQVAHARPDGRTLLVTSSGVLAANQFLYKQTGFDSLKDLAPVIRLANQPNVLLVRPSLPVKSLQELIALAKAKPGLISFGSAGIGTGQDIAERQLIAATGIDVLHVPYRGGAPVVKDMAAGLVDAAFDTAPTALPYARENGTKLRALAISSARRSALLPQLPTIAESGIAGFDSSTWIGVVAPAKTPESVITQLNTALNAALRGPMGKGFTDMALEPLGGTPQAMAESIRKDSATYGAILKAAGVAPK